jgi:ABC-type iron transport system FetAB ATPase subunit
MITALSIAALTKSFRAGVAGCSARVSVLRDLDLALWPGEIVAVEGSAGCGRSTLLRCAAGLLSPESGAIHWFGARAVKRGAVAYVCAAPGAECGALYAALLTVPRHARLIVVDDLSAASALERRLALSLLRGYALSGAAILLSAGEELATAPVVSRAYTLANGALLQRRKRSAVRIAVSSPDSRARASARSTYGRSLRSPQ